MMRTDEREILERVTEQVANARWIDDRFLLVGVLGVSGLKGFLVLVVYVIVVWTLISVVIASIGVPLGLRAQRDHVQPPPPSEHVVRLDIYRVTHEDCARERAE